MNVLQTIDITLFRLGNQSLSNPFFDWLMPVVSGNALFMPALLVLAGLLLWKGGARGRIFVAFLLIALLLGDGLVCNTLKKALARPRPCLALDHVMLRIGCTETGSMPSSHAANWFTAAMVAFLYYRRSIWFMLPMALLVSFSRVYNGVHYPSDTLVGAILGAGYAAAWVWSVDALWRWGGPKWFPLWWRQRPSLMCPEVGGAEVGDRKAAEWSAKAEMSGALMREGCPLSPALSPEGGEGEDRIRLSAADRQWLNLGYLLLGMLLVARLLYLAVGRIELSKDEAYQWLWSKHLALSYFSKPPIIAYLHYLGTHLWGDNELGSRFFSPVLGSVLGWLTLRFLAREGSARAGFWLLLVVTATPLLSVGTILITVDPPLVLCWTAAMLAGWRALRPESTTRDWLLVGLLMGLGFLSKYTALLQLICWGLVFWLLPQTRVHLRRAGPWLAVGVNLLCTLPVVIWNAQNGWITLIHVADNAKLNEPWHFTFRFFWDFIGLELGILNPIFLVAALWASVTFWKRSRHRTLLTYLFCMGTPVFLGHWLYTLHSRVLPNWIAVSVVPMWLVMTLYWEERWEAGSRAVKRWLLAGLWFGLPLVLLAHETDLFRKITGRSLPPQADTLRRVRGWRGAAAVVEQARQKLLAEGKPVFIIGDHYGLAGELTFYLPEARASLARQPLVFCRRTPTPENQFYFWPGYRELRGKGENALYIHEGDLPTLDPGWFKRWLAGETKLASGPAGGLLGEPDRELVEDFESVTPLGVFEACYKGRYYRPVQIFACHGLR